MHCQDMRYATANLKKELISPSHHSSVCLLLIRKIC